MRWWKASISQSVIARKEPRPIVSGAFASEVLQKVGLLSHNEYFLALEFAQKSRANKKGEVKRDGKAIGTFICACPSCKLCVRAHPLVFINTQPTAHLHSVRVGAEMRIPPPPFKSHHFDQENEPDAENEHNGAKTKAKDKAKRKITKEKKVRTFVVLPSEVSSHRYTFLFLKHNRPHCSRKDLL